MNTGWIPSMIKTMFSEKKAMQFQPCATMDDRLFTSAMMHGVCFEALGRVEIVSVDHDLTKRLAEVLLDQSADICFSRDLASLQNSNVLLVDIDGLGGILGLIDQLLCLRAQNRSRIIILLSAEFSRDDFDADRLSVCDASLRLPFSYARLEQAFVEAESNNMIWQDQRIRPPHAIWASKAQLKKA